MWLMLKQPMRGQIALIFLAGGLMISVMTPIDITAATLAEFKFKDPAQTEAFRALTEQLRCLVCQNESLADSQADLAQDLRQKIYKMMQAGQSTSQIVDFLVARYGDFILYSPPFKPATYLLWYAPFAFFAVALAFFIKILLRQRLTNESDLSVNERARLAALLIEKPPNSITPS